MNELDLPTIPERVEKGIAWLEEHGGEAWAQKIADACDLGAFNLQSDCSCAVGTVLLSFDQDYRDVREEEIGEEEAWAEACRFGFWVQTDRGLMAADAEFREVEAEWERKARERVAWLAEIDE